MSTNEVSSHMNQKLDSSARCAQSHARNLARQEARYKAAEDRNSKYRGLSTQEKIKHLDDLLGSGTGAVKQRRKLANILAKEKATTKK